ncbi:MAG: hypothetical protein G01um101425_745 [Candidatus Peregrinibacteria bacterium Gr01-1014_25]|nr:MAG: hypothetical protein G01um101425_745 [Candidatus Peregrinibacteria bacterium Gr01-1014_25]
MTNAIVESAVRDEQEKVKNSPESVGEFTKNVEDNVRERIDAMREIVGDSLPPELDEAMEEARSYSETKANILDPDMHVADTAKDGNAGVYDVASGDIAIDDEAMDAEPDDAGYWERVGKHEKIHAEQADEHNADALAYTDASGAMQGVEVEELIEGEATQENEDGDLTPEYLEHKRTWKRVAAIVGETRLKQALHSGDIVALQKAVLEEEAPDHALAV